MNALDERLFKVEQKHVMNEEAIGVIKCDVTEIWDVCTTKSWAEISLVTLTIYTTTQGKDVGNEDREE